MLRMLGFLLIAGAVIYGLLWLAMMLRNRGEGGGAPARPPVAPDDDPEFLAQLDVRLRQERRRQAEREAREAAAADGQAESPPPERPDQDDSDRGDSDQEGTGGRTG